MTSFQELVALAVLTAKATASVALELVVDAKTAFAVPLVAVNGIVVIVVV